LANIEAFINLDKIKAIDVNYQQFTAVAIYSRRKK